MPHDTARVMNARTPDTKNYEIMKKKNGINQPAVLHNSNNHIDKKKMKIMDRGMAVACVLRIGLFLPLFAIDKMVYTIINNINSYVSAALLACACWIKRSVGERHLAHFFSFVWRAYVNVFFCYFVVLMCVALLRISFFCGVCWFTNDLKKKKTTSRRPGRGRDAQSTIADAHILPISLCNDDVRPEWECKYHPSVDIFSKQISTSGQFAIKTAHRHWQTHTVIELMVTDHSNHHTDRLCRLWWPCSISFPSIHIISLALSMSVRYSPMGIFRVALQAFGSTSNVVTKPCFVSHFGLISWYDWVTRHQCLMVVPVAFARLMRCDHRTTCACSRFNVYAIYTYIYLYYVHTK